MTYDDYLEEREIDAAIIHIGESQYLIVKFDRVIAGETIPIFVVPDKHIETFLYNKFFNAMVFNSSDIDVTIEDIMKGDYDEEILAMVRDGAKDVNTEIKWHMDSLFRLTTFPLEGIEYPIRYNQEQSDILVFDDALSEFRVSLPFPLNFQESMAIYEIFMNFLNRRFQKLGMMKLIEKAEKAYNSVTGKNVDILVDCTVPILFLCSPGIYAAREECVHYASELLCLDFYVQLDVLIHEFIHNRYSEHSPEFRELFNKVEKAFYEMF
ncbi:hypothetical protein MKA27_20845 [[Clostridium] innocuum]|uniref:hypothetical protein n=1 Tax=Clostridium innocuum TaxID=1522 RepID=UPI000D6BCE37|nr:hypothetical protein [[Clostridium] innocuum]MCR0317209.1 hypothetical protein [[Clostridium] innocuum]MCR0369780.1 hypothetical protein [[Clostridium] innocuum]MCR0376240.1 hypothetical protein [[Clostridium] innocuum]MCR0559733.1 hypothetical protein [[Clostridium] innocuum]MCR0602573.1 hypothetical protein [[Clostridium] innocuum]